MPEKTKTAAIAPEYDVNGRRFSNFDQAIGFAEQKALSGGEWTISEKIEGLPWHVLRVVTASDVGHVAD